MKVAISLLQSIQLSPCQTNRSAPTAHLGTSSLGSPHLLVQVQVPKQWTSCLVILPFLKSLLPSSFNLLSSSSSSRLLPAASYPASPQPLSRRPALPILLLLLVAAASLSHSAHFRLHTAKRQASALGLLLLLMYLLLLLMSTVNQKCSASERQKLQEGKHAHFHIG